MLKISFSLFSAWNDAELRYCHWKSNEHLMPGLAGDTDLDVLLSETDKKRGEEILRSLEFLECRSQYGSRYPGVSDWIGFDKETGKLIHVHLHFRLVTGHKGMKEYNLPWTERTLQTRIYNEEYNVWMMEPNLELVTLYTRFGLKADVIKKNKAKNGVFRLGKDDIAEITYLKNKVDWSQVQQIINEYYPNDYEEILEIINSETLSSSQFLRLISITENTMDSYRRTIPLYQLKKRYWRVWMKLLKIWRKKTDWVGITRKTPISGKGLVVAFLGQDGSGKSTVTIDIEKWLSWKMDVRRFYLGSGEHWNPWQKKVLKIIPNVSVFKPIRAIVSLLQTMSLARNKKKTITTACRYRNMGGVAMYDRFPQTRYLGINDGPAVRSKYMKTLGKGILKPLVEMLANREECIIGEACKITPDVVIKLMLSPEESIRRKPFENYDAVKIKHDIIKNLEFPQASVYTIDATQPYVQELILIKNILWNHIRK